MYFWIVKCIVFQFPLLLLSVNTNVEIILLINCTICQLFFFSYIALTGYVNNSSKETFFTSLSLCESSTDPYDPFSFLALIAVIDQQGDQGSRSRSLPLKPPGRVSSRTDFPFFLSNRRQPRAKTLWITYEVPTKRSQRPPLCVLFLQ